jgi:hypothetical protein
MYARDCSGGAAPFGGDGAIDLRTFVHRVGYCLLTLASGVLYERMGGLAFFVMATLCLLALPMCAGLRPSQAQVAIRTSTDQEMVIPLSTGYTCPATIRVSSDARNTAIFAMSSGSIRPIRCAAAIFVTRGLPASNRPRTRSVICHGWCDRIDPHLLRREFQPHRSRNRRDAALRSSVAIEAGNAHQRHIRCNVDHRSPTRGDYRRYAEPTPEERAEQVQTDRTPEFLDRSLDDRIVRWG